jgi:hypothetical protein
MSGMRLLIATSLGAACLVFCGEAAAQARLPPPQWQDPAGPPVAADVWLRRLVGRYRIEGMVEVVYDHPDYIEHRCGPLPPDPNQSDNPPPPAVPYCSGIKGKGDCVGIGSGPGVQCILDVSWQDIYTQLGANLPGGVSYLSPAMLLFGLDPTQAAIHHLLVDNKGLPEGGPGANTGNRATFKTTCVNAPILLSRMPEVVPDERRPDRPREWQTCNRVTRFSAKPDSRVVNISMDIDINDETFTRLEITMRRVEPGESAEK